MTTVSTVSQAGISTRPAMAAINSTASPAHYCIRTPPSVSQSPKRLQSLDVPFSIDEAEAVQAFVSTLSYSGLWSDILDPDRFIVTAVPPLRSVR